MRNYLLILENIIKEKVSSGCTYLETLKESNGADPREVWQIFKKYKLKYRKKIDLINQYPEFPEPHLAYCQWRISKNSTKLILKELIQRKYKEVCFLGCPILGIEFEKKMPQKSFLLDIDRTILDYARKFTHKIKIYDINDEVPSELKNKFECVIIDPPWYHNQIKLFLYRSAQLAKKNGTIYLSLPGILTRPSVLEERLDLQNYLRVLNLKITTLNYNRIEYEVPPFEYMAYYDIPAFTGENWRRGDQLKLKKIKNSRYKLRTKIDKECWLEFAFNKKRIFLREKKLRDNYQKPQLSSLYPDNSLILRSASRRNPILPRIDIWTSRNAVIHIDKGFSVIRTMLTNFDKQDSEIIEQITKKYNKSAQIVSKDCKKIIQKLRALVSI